MKGRGKGEEKLDMSPARLFRHALGWEEAVLVVF
jgi:hypothetical protein